MHLMIGVLHDHLFEAGAPSSTKVGQRVTAI